MLNTDNLTWHCRDVELSLSRPRVMGILNVTPDSFSDGGVNFDTSRAIERGMEMLDQGADIIDVGGESTRPGFEPVSADEEAKRVVPVVRALTREGALVSVDTRHVEVAKACTMVGAQILNDVTGFTDPQMVELAAETGSGCIVMHSGVGVTPVARKSVHLDTDPTAPKAGEEQGETDELAEDADAADAAAAGDASEDQGRDELHEIMASARSVSEAVARKGPGSRRYTLPEEAPIMRGVLGFLGDTARELGRAGVSQNAIAIDPGVGFGKSVEEDVVIQRATTKMASLGYPLVCALSRKRVTGALGGADVSGRDPITYGMAIAAAEAGARILRVHDVEGMVQALEGYWSVAHPTIRRAFVALGSNVGDRMAYLAKACEAIDVIPLTCVTAVSKAYESEPAYGIATRVANAAVEVRTELSPMVLLENLLAVEDELGRMRKPGEEGHGPRTIDCDLAWMEGERHAGRKLTLPHKGLGERDFVLRPLADLQNDPVRFLRNSGVRVVEDADRVGRIASELGEIAWV